MSTKMRLKKVCEFCGDEFVAKTTTTKYCCLKCGSNAYKKRQRDEKIKRVELETAMRLVEKSAGFNFKDKEVFTVTDAARFLSVTRPTIYAWMKCGKLKSKRVSNRKLFITRKSLDEFLEATDEYERPDYIKRPLYDYYTYDQVLEKFDVSLSWLYVIIEKRNISKVKRNGVVYLLKEEIDAYFDEYDKNINNIKDWYTVEEIIKKFDTTRDSIYGRCKTYKIPRKKEGRFILISQKHFDELYDK